MVQLSRSVFFRLAFLLLFGLAAFLPVNAEIKDAESGILDAREVDLDKTALPLTGYWNYFESKLLTPEECLRARGRLVHFPDVWNKEKGYGDALGYGTYHLTLLINSRQYKSLNFDLPQVYNSYQLFINDKNIASNGRVGATMDTSTPQWLPQIVSIDSETDTLEITLQISNFHHHTGGVKDAIYVGANNMLLQKHNVTIASNMAEATCLVLLSITFLVVFFQRGKKKIIAYFSLLCITWATRSVFSNQYLFISFVPDFSWSIMVKIEYITIYLTLIWAVLFLSRLFANERSIIIKYFLVTCNILFTVFTVLTDPLYFTRWLTIYLLFAGFLIVYAMYVVVKALINERTGALLLSITILLAIATFSYDIFTFEGLFTYNAIVFSVGYVTIFLLMGIALLQHLDIIKSKPKPTTMLRFEDFYKKED